MIGRVYAPRGAGFAFLAFFLACVPASFAAAAGNVVISQVYGAGGNTGAALQNDYVELFNRSATTVSLSGWSVQYASATGTGNFSSSVVALSGSIAPGHYFLLQLAGGANGSPLPTADQSSTAINMAAGGGKVILANVATGLACNGSSTACSAAQLAQIVDLVGQGSANFYEGSGTAPTPSTTLADFRANGGCTDTDDNKADFATAAPAPRNSASAGNAACGGNPSTNPAGTGSASPAAVQAGATSLLTVAVAQGTNPASPIQSVTANLSSIGGSSTQTLYDDGTNGDAVAGDGTYSYVATVAANTPSGGKTLNVTIADAVPRTGTTTIALAVTSAPLTIMQIQGHGAASAYAGQVVTTTGPDIVTALDTNGFFVQDAAGDNDLTTSDAIFVFTSTPPTVHVGDAVQVTGTVVEFNGSSELSAPSVTVLSSGNTLPAAYDLSTHAPTTSPTTGICMGVGSTINPPVDGYQSSNFACLDGMLVAMSDGVVVAPTFGAGGSGIKADTVQGFYATVASQPRPFREPGLTYPGDATHPLVPVFDGNPETVEIYFGGLPLVLANLPNGGIYNSGQHFSVTGIVQGFKGTYEIYPTGNDAFALVGAAKTYPVPVPDSTPGTLTVGSQNMLHFFNNTADGADTSAYNDTCTGTGANDQCPTLTQYQARLAKMSLQIRTVLKAPVIQVVQEAENLSAMRDLAAQMSLDDASVSYQPYLIPGNDPGGINLGFFARDGVAVNSVTQLYKGTTTSACSSGSSCLLNDRPPVLLDANYHGYRVRVLAIYDRSLLNLGVNDYVGIKRRAQAEQIACIVRALQTTGANVDCDANNPGAYAGNAIQNADGSIVNGGVPVVGDASVPVVVVGDFNAYEFSDGYVDVTGLIMGTADTDPAHSIYPPSASYVAPNPALWDSGAAQVPADHYSYTFSGYAQEIDHILLSDTGKQDFIQIGNAHGNADVSSSSSDVLDPTTARRSSDHDGQVVTLGYVVDIIAGNHGSAEPTGQRLVSKGARQVVNVTPDPGYFATTSGSCGGALNGSTYLSDPVAANCNVVVTFTPSPIDGACGSDNGQVLLVPPTNLCSVGSASAIDGSGHPWSWSCSGQYGGAAATCAATIKTWTVSASAGSNGGISPATQTVDNNTMANFTVTPNPGYAATVTGCDGTLLGNVYTTGPVTADCAVSATFTPAVYTVTPVVVGGNGTLTPAAPQQVGYQAVVNFRADPAPGYKVATVTGCGATFNNKKIQTAPISDSCTLAVTFARANQ